MVRETYRVETDRRVESLDSFSHGIEPPVLGLIVEEGTLDQLHSLGWALAEDVVKET